MRSSWSDAKPSTPSPTSPRPDDAGAPRSRPDAASMTAFLARCERFDRVGSTNDVVREWLAGGTPEVCLAIADEQSAGRGRALRTWTAPPGAALLVSLGFRPTWL